MSRFLPDERHRHQRVQTGRATLPFKVGPHRIKAHRLIGQLLRHEIKLAGPVHAQRKVGLPQEEIVCRVHERHRQTFSE